MIDGSAAASGRGKGAGPSPRSLKLVSVRRNRTHRRLALVDVALHEILQLGRAIGESEPFGLRHHGVARQALVDGAMDEAAMPVRRPEAQWM